MFFQRRGFGLSDQVPYVPTLEQQADDVIAVMDAVGMQQPLSSVGSPPAVRWLSSPPEHPNASMLSSSSTPWRRAGSIGELHGWTQQRRERGRRALQAVVAAWGSGGLIDLFEPAMVTGFNRRLMALLERSSATPAAARANYEWLRPDIQDILSSVQAPTRVLRAFLAAWPEAAVRHVAELIPRALSSHPLPRLRVPRWAGRAPMCDQLEEVATGIHATEPIDSSEPSCSPTWSRPPSCSKVGDATYRQLRADHERLVRLAVDRAGGDLITVTGDGTLSVFDGPSAAVRCAETICDDAEEAGIAVRAGIHTGEIEREA